MKILNLIVLASLITLLMVSVVSLQDTDNSWQTRIESGK